MEVVRINENEWNVELLNLLDKRIIYKVDSKVNNQLKNFQLDPFLGAIFGPVLQNFYKGEESKNIKNFEDFKKSILKYWEDKDIGSSFMPILQRKMEAPNYHYEDYKFISNEEKIKILKNTLSYYYIDLKQKNSEVIIGIRTDNLIIKEIIEQNFRKIGSSFGFELNVNRIEIPTKNNKFTYLLPQSPSAAYYLLLLLLGAVFDLMKDIYEKIPNETNLDIEILIQKNNGGNKWSVVYYNSINLYRLYKLFFADIDGRTKEDKPKFLEFLASLNVRSPYILDSYYFDLSAFSYSLLIEGYFNFEKLSEIINEKISLELKAKREDPKHFLGGIYFLDYVQKKFLEDENMSQDFGDLRNRMKGIAIKIGDLSSLGDTQRSLLKRIIMDVKAEDIPSGFASSLFNYLPRLERENIFITLPSELSSLPIREFLIIKNEFLSILWNKYIKNEQRGDGE